jgi:hypothetical protein
VDEGTGSATLAAILAAFCCLMGNPDRFDSMSFSPTGGIQTKVRQAIQQVQVTIDQLQKLATALAEASLNELALSGQVFVGMPTAEKFRIRDQIIGRLSSIGVGQDDTLRAQRMWIFVNCSELEGQIKSAATKAFPSSDVNKEVIQPARSNGQNGLPTQEALKQWVTEKGVIDPNVNELLQEMRAYGRPARCEIPI